MSLERSFLAIFLSVVTLMLISLLVFLELVDTEKHVAALEMKRYQSYLLADELRQSSDDLTRMVRTYANTGERRYQDYFQQILAIRNGQAPRPLDYHLIYWDFVAATGAAPRANTEARSLKALMVDAEFTETEFALLQEAENESTQLVNMENQAMRAVAGNFTDEQGRSIERAPDPERARQLVYSDEYHQAKARIMRPLEKFFVTIEERTTGAVVALRDKQERLNVILIITQALTIFLVFSSLLLAIFSLQQTRKQDSKSKMMHRLTARGYQTDGVENHKETLKRLVGGKAELPEDDAQKSEPAHFLNNLWKDWPLIVAASVVVFITLGISWWFTGESKTLAYTDVRNELNSNLDATHSAVTDWLERTIQDASVFAEIISRNINPEILTSMQVRPDHPSHRRLEEISIGASKIFENYILTDLDGVIISSNLRSLIGQRFDVDEATLMQARTMPDHRIVLFPPAEGAPEAFSADIIFGLLLTENKGIAFFTMNSGRALTSILKNGYSGNYGEIYMVNKQGRFVSESRWKETLMDYGWIGSYDGSIVGEYVSQNRNATEPELPLSVAEASIGKDNISLESYENYLGKQVIGVWLWDNTYGFGLINEFRRDGAFAAFQLHRRQAIAGSGFTIALILALTMIFISSRVRVRLANEKLKGAYETIKKSNDKLAQDMRIGQKVQTDMLPEAIKGDAFSLEAFLKPAQSVSGDFYDFSVMSNGKIHFCVADVSGKGVPAALFMAMTKALLDKALDISDQPKEVINKVNQELSSNNYSSMFVTMVLGIIDLETGALLITNAGHNLPYIKRHNGEVVCLEKVQGPLVGTFEDITYEQQPVQMHTGDMLLFYTDGVTEAQNIKDEFYEDERLVSVIQREDVNTAAHMTKAVFRNVARFIGRAQQFDDITILSFEYKGKPPTKAPPAVGD